MKLIKNLLDLDLAIQTLIIGIACLILVLAIFSPFMLIYYLMLQLAIGVWQVISAFVIVMITGNKKRLQYLVAVLAYFFNLTISNYFLEEMDIAYKFTQIIMWVAIPAIFALWYFITTYNDAKKEGEKAAHSQSANGNQSNIWSTKEFV